MVRATALAIMLAALGCGVQAQAPPAWPGPPIQPMDWAWFNYSRDFQIAYLTRFAQAGPAYPRIWTRIEYAKGFDGNWFTPAGRTLVKSAVTLEEFDCGEHRSRTLQFTEYAEANLAGVDNTVTAPAGWIYTTPGTFSEALERMVCAFPRTVPKTPRATRK